MNQAPQFLEPFLDGTPLAIERIRQAWPELAMSDRAYLLSVLLADRRNDTRALEWVRHRDALIDLALEDENGYIRYLAAKHVPKPGKDADDSAQARRRKVITDSVALVQSAHDELPYITLSIFGHTPTWFWKHTQTERLALANGLDNGEFMADILRYAAKELLPKETVTVDEMVDVLLQFLGTDFAHDFAQSSKRARGSREPDDMYWLSKNVKALWKVIPALPPLLSYTLLDCLPEPPHSPIPTEVIEALDEGQLGHLLTRDEITLKELRRKIYEECANNALCRSAVSSQHFELLDSDITALALATESEQSSKRVEKIIVLAESCGGATLVQMEAIGDFFIAQRDKKADDDYEVSPTRRDWDGFGPVPAVNPTWDAAKEAQANRTKKLSPERLETEVLEMRLYELAKTLNMRADQGIDRNAGRITSGDFTRLPDRLKAHLQLVTPHDPWSTYLKLRSAVPWEQWRRSKADLPSVYIRDLDLPEDPDEDTKSVSPPASTVFDLVNEVQAKVSGMSELDHAELSALSAALTSISTQMREANVLTERNVGRLRARLNFALWLLGAVLLFLLVRFA
jgi:hypothetical protein